MDTKKKILAKIFELFDARGYPPPNAIKKATPGEVLQWITADHDILRLKIFLSGLGLVCHKQLQEEELLEALDSYILDLIMEDAYYYLESLSRPAADVASSLFATLLVLIEKVPERTLVSFVKRYMESLLDEVSHFTFRLEALKSLNEILNFCTKEERMELENATERKVEPFVSLLFTIGDYEFQVGVVEAVFRLKGKKARPALAEKMFPEPDLISAFMAIKGETFEEDCRNFLVLLNSKLEEENRVYSCPCLAVKFGSIWLEVPEGQKLWVDFNRGSERISVLCKPQGESWRSSQTQEGGSSLEAVSVPVDKVAIYTYTERDEDETVLATLELTEDIADLNPALDEVTGTRVEISTVSCAILEALKLMFQPETKMSVVEEPLLVEAVTEASLPHVVRVKQERSGGKRQSKTAGSVQESLDSETPKASVAAEPLYLGDSFLDSVPESQALSEDDIIPGTLPPPKKTRGKFQQDDSGVCMNMSTSFSDAPNKSLRKAQGSQDQEDLSLKTSTPTSQPENAGKRKGKHMQTASKPKADPKKQDAVGGKGENLPSTPPPAVQAHLTPTPAVKQGSSGTRQASPSSSQATPVPSQDSQGGDRSLERESPLSEEADSPLPAPGKGDHDPNESQQPGTLSPSGGENERHEPSTQTPAVQNQSGGSQKSATPSLPSKERKKSGTTVARLENDLLRAYTARVKEVKKAQENLGTKSTGRFHSPSCSKDAETSKRSEEVKPKSLDVYNFDSEEEEEEEESLPHSSKAKGGKSTFAEDSESDGQNISQFSSPSLQSVSQSKKAGVKRKQTTAKGTKKRGGKSKKAVSKVQPVKDQQTQKEKVETENLDDSFSQLEEFIDFLSPQIGRKSLRQRKPINYNEDARSSASFAESKMAKEGATPKAKSKSSQEGDAVIKQKKSASGGRKNSEMDDVHSNQAEDVEELQKENPYNFDLNCQVVSVARNQPTQSYKAVVANVSYRDGGFERTVWEQHLPIPAKSKTAAKKTASKAKKGKKKTAAAVPCASPDIVPESEATDVELSERDSSPCGLFSSAPQEKKKTWNRSKKNTGRRQKRKQKKETTAITWPTEDNCDSLSDYELVIGTPAPRPVDRVPLAITPSSVPSQIQAQEDKWGTSDEEAGPCKTKRQKTSRGNKSQPSKTSKHAQQRATAKQAGRERQRQENQEEEEGEQGVGGQAGRATPPSQSRVASKQSRGGEAGSPPPVPTPETGSGYQSPVDFFSDNEGSPLQEALSPALPKQARAVPPLPKPPSKWQQSTHHSPFALSLEPCKQIAQESSETSFSDVDTTPVASRKGLKTTAGKGGHTKRVSKTRSSPRPSERTPSMRSWLEIGQDRTPVGLRLNFPSSSLKMRGSLPLEISFSSPSAKLKTSTPLQPRRQSSSAPRVRFESDDDEEKDTELNAATYGSSILHQNMGLHGLTDSLLCSPSTQMLRVIQEVLYQGNAARKPQRAVDQSAADSDDDRSAHLSDEDVDESPPPKRRGRPPLKRKYEERRESDVEQVQGSGGGRARQGRGRHKSRPRASPTTATSAGKEEEEDAQAMAPVQMKRPKSDSRQKRPCAAEEMGTASESSFDDVASAFRERQRTAQTIMDDFFTQVSELLDAMDREGERSQKALSNLTATIKNTIQTLRACRASESNSIDEMKALFKKHCRDMRKNDRHTTQKLRLIWEKEVADYFSLLRKEVMNKLQQRELDKIRSSMSSAFQGHHGM